MNRLAAVLETVWHRKWWILAPTVVTAVVTSAISYHMLPDRYKSESTVIVRSPRVPADYVRPMVSDRFRARVEQLSQMILSRTRLERIINDFDLYEVERQTAPLSEVIQQMREDIHVDFLSTSEAPENDVTAFKVSFVSSDPRLAQRTTERLTSLFIEENLRSRETLVEGTNQFIESQIADVRRRIIEAETSLEELRTENGRRPPSQADLLPYEVLLERYRALLLKREEARTADGLERRQIGEQFRLIDAARMPDRPVGPSRVTINAAGAFGGLALGMVLVGIRGRRSKDTPVS
jgi:uncharacterized protein involved in exopolysaccharide biosynthesis